MKKLIINVVVALAVAAVCIFAFNAIVYGSFTFWAPKYEEAKREVVQQSTRRQEGLDQQISAFCLNMKTERDIEVQKVFAAMIITTVESTKTPINTYSTNCLAEARNKAVEGS